jgi:O-antigen/teichoic acid export membrane protein
VKASKFIRDISATGLTQIAVVLLSVILLRIMATTLSKEYFGVLMIVRRIIAIGAPLITLNLGIGLARYVSYEREKEKEFLSVALPTVCFVGLLTTVLFILFRYPLSGLFFKASEYSNFVGLSGLFVFSYGIFSVSYAFFRGRQDMSRANRMQIAYYGFPIVLVTVLWVIFPEQHSRLLALYFVIFSLWGISLGIANVRHEMSLRLWPNIRERFESTKHLFSYSLSRIPSGFFLALTFGIPVFVASRRISLVAAGYVGIAVAIVRLMEVFATPFNLLFLPKFAEIKKRNDPQEISAKTSVVIDFIITALPLFVVIAYGLSKYIVIGFFDGKYAAAIPSVSMIILFSAFYVAYVLIRGILDGLLSFPYVNVICLSGFLVTALFCFAYGQTIGALSIGLGLGLLTMGISGFCVLTKKGKVDIKAGKLLISLLLAALVFAVLWFLDGSVSGLPLNEYIRFCLVLLYRVVLILALFLFYWKPNALWVRELLQRVGHT